MSKLFRSKLFSTMAISILMPNPRLDSIWLDIQLTDEIHVEGN